DGGAAECVLLHAYPDRFTHEFLIDQRHPPERIVRNVWAAVQSTAGAGRSAPTRLDLGALARKTNAPGGVGAVDAALRALERAGAWRILDTRGVEESNVRSV